MARNIACKLISSKAGSVLPDYQPLPAYDYKFQEVILLSLKIIRKNFCGPDVYKTWIFACTSIADANNLSFTALSKKPF